jgi:uncharacterized membrane protein YkvI
VRALGYGAAAGLALTLAGALGVLVGDGPYLRFSALSPWLVAYALGLIVLLALLPFAIHRRLAARGTDRDRRWELAVVAWGGLALAGLVAFGLVSVLQGFETGDPLGALALAGALLCGLVVGSILLLILTTG